MKKTKDIFGNDYSLTCNGQILEISVHEWVDGKFIENYKVLTYKLVGENWIQIQDNARKKSIEL